MKICTLLLAGLLLFSSWGCHPSWWEVTPKDIYSPADFSKPYSVTVDQSHIIAEFNPNLRNLSADTLGAYLYSDLSSLLLQLTKRDGTIDISGKSGFFAQNQWVKSEIKNERAKVTFNRNSETTTYFLPVLRNYTTPSTYINYFPANYLKIQTSPWSRLANVSLSNSLFFTDSSSLFYLNRDVSNFYFFKLNPATNRFNQIGVSSTTAIGDFYINDIYHVAYDKKSQQYYLINSASSGRIQFIGKLILDNEFNIVDYQLLTGLGANGSTTNFKKIYSQNDTLHVLYNLSYKGLTSIYKSVRSAVSLTTGETLFSYEIKEINDSLTTIAFIGNDVLLKYTNKPTFIYYGLNKPRQEIPFPTGIDQTITPFAVEYSNSAYMSAGQGDSMLYKVQLTKQNKVDFKDLGLTVSREPSSNIQYQYCSQGLMYRGNLALLYLPTSVNSIKIPSELWQLYPTRTNITLQNPYTEVIPVNY